MKTLSATGCSSGFPHLLALVGGISLLAAGPSLAAPQILWDARAVSIGAVNNANTSSGNVVILDNGHTVNIYDNSGGSRMVLDIYAVFNENVATDTFNRVSGALVSSSTTGGLSGSITAAYLPANLNEVVAGAQVGIGGLELSGVYDPAHGLLAGTNGGISSGANPYISTGTADNILDWGETVANRNVSPGNWFVPTSAGAQSLSVDALDNSKKSILVGEFILDLTPGTTGSTIEGFYIRPKGVNAATAAVANYNYNGIVKIANYTGNSGVTVSPNDSFAFQNVVITVPEPSTFGMIALGAVALTGFRRLGLRRRS